jgi:hypothetical protein
MMWIEAKQVSISMQRFQVLVGYNINAVTLNHGYFANGLNSRGVYNSNLASKISVKNPDFNKRVGCASNEAHGFYLIVLSEPRKAG